MLAPIRSVGCNFELPAHQIVHNLEEVYRLNHPIRIPNIYKVCHPPIQRLRVRKLIQKNHLPHFINSSKTRETKMVIVLVLNL